jgi:hypothetical protein
MHSSSVFLRTTLLILGLVFCLGGFQVTSAQPRTSTLSQALPQASTEEIRERISAIIRENIRQGEGATVDGIKFSTRVPPSLQNIEEIKRYGERAIPVLEEYLWAEAGREGDLALRFLSLLGGNRIVEPLRRVVEKSPSPSRREGALRGLSQAPWDLAFPIIRNAAEADPDPRVREVAREFLNNPPQRR